MQPGRGRRIEQPSESGKKMIRKFSEGVQKFEEQRIRQMKKESGK